MHDEWAIINEWLCMFGAHGEWVYLKRVRCLGTYYTFKITLLLYSVHW